MADDIAVFNEEMKEMKNMMYDINSRKIEIKVNTENASYKLKVFKEEALNKIKEINEEFEKLSVGAWGKGTYIMPTIGIEKLSSEGEGSKPTIYDGLSSGDIISMFTNGILDGVGTGVAIGTAIKSKYAVAIGAIIGGITGAVNSAIEIFENDDDAYRNYVKDQYESIYENRMSEVSTGSLMAENYGMLAESDPYNYKSGLMSESGEAYNSIVAEANNKYNSMLAESGMKELYDAQAIFEGKKEAEKIGYKTDVIGYITGERDELEMDYSDYMVTNIESMRQKYNDAMEIYLKGENGSSEEVFNKALADLQEVKSVMESIADNAYLESDLGQLGDEINNRIVDGIQASSAETFEEAGYNLGKNLAQGINSALNTYMSYLYKPTITPLTADSIRKGLANEGMSDENIEKYIDKTVSANKNAYGIQYVPYNGYRAVLHEGERVLTARENREYNKNYGGFVINVNGMTVREEADIENIASQLAKKLYEADMGFYGDLGLHY